MTPHRDDLEPGRLRRRNHGRGHSYYLDGIKVDGVTTILNALPINLKQWSANIAAEYAVEHWAELAEEPLTKRLDRIRYAHRDTLTKAAARGTQIHAIGEKISHGEAVEVPPEHRGPVEAYARFLDDWQIEPIATETPLANTTYHYGGTADLWATIGVRDGARALVDLKTGSVYESVVLQLSAYLNADLWQPNGVASEEHRGPDDVDLVYVAQIGSDAVRMLPVRVDETTFRAFLYVQQTSRWLAAHNGYNGDDPLVGDAEEIGVPA